MTRGIGSSRNAQEKSLVLRAFLCRRYRRTTPLQQVRARPARMSQGPGARRVLLTGTRTGMSPAAFHRPRNRAPPTCATLACGARSARERAPVHHRAPSAPCVVRSPTRSYVKPRSRYPYRTRSYATPRGRTLAGALRYDHAPPGYDHATPGTTTKDPETPNHRHPPPTTPSHTKDPITVGQAAQFPRKVSLDTDTRPPVTLLVVPGGPGLGQLLWA